ncbi:MAG: histidine phosphatase family protein [Roseburia sp.]|nr:histidine phosphatase family protein [Roseburia sp.]
MIFYFVRHGETDWNVQKKIQGTTDVPLNANGLRQARLLAEKLVDGSYKIERAYTSPHLRAQVTAQLVAKALGIECVDLPDLAEMDLGVWEGDNWPNIEEVYGEVYHYWNSHRRYVRTPGGECYNDVLKRTFRALEYMMKNVNGNVLVLSHSAIMMSLRCYLAGGCMDDETMLDYRAKNTEVVEIDAEEIKKAIKRFRREEEEYKDII